jgi:endonuclease/exonuclease/phosphatase family metal-dependent hydrolase
VEIEGKNVCVITLHFDWQDRDTRVSQIKQVIEFAKKHEYVMIIGDFNPTDFVNAVKQSDNLTYKEDLDIFRKEGFKVANTDKFGTFTTIVERSPCYPCDNIVVSPNIKILKVDRIYRDWMNDHTALWADVEL